MDAMGNMQLKNNAHTLNAWYIYLHLPQKLPKLR